MNPATPRCPYADKAPGLQRQAETAALGDAIAELSARIQAATYELLVMVREFDEREGWGGGFTSCAHWLNWRTGLAMGAAREKVRVARALADLPQLSEAMRRGAISYSKVRAITRVAIPETEERVLDFAHCATAAHVERLVRAWRRVDRIAEAEDDQRRHASRHLDVWVDEDGILVVRGRLSPEVGAVVQRALEAAGEQLYRESQDEVPATGSAREQDPTSSPTVGQRRADALGLIRRERPDRPPRSRHDRRPVSGRRPRRCGWPGRQRRRRAGGAGRRHRRSRGIVPAHRVRCLRRGHASRPGRHRSGRWPQDPDHPAGDPPGAGEPRPSVPLSRLRVTSLRCAPPTALGGRWRERGSRTSSFCVDGTTEPCTRTASRWSCEMTARLASSGLTVALFQTPHRCLTGGARRLRRRASNWQPPESRLTRTRRPQTGTARSWM